MSKINLTLVNKNLILVQNKKNKFVFNKITYNDVLLSYY